METGGKSILDCSLDDLIQQERSSERGRGRGRTDPSRGPRGQKRDRDASAEPIRVARRIYVSNLAPRTSWQDLKDFCRSVGTVVYADVLGERGRSKGSGIVEFETPQEAAAAINELHLAELDGSQIYVREDREDFELRGERGPSARKQARRSGGSTAAAAAAAPGTRLFVSNLSFETSWQGLKDAFRECGEVAFADVLTDANGRSKGVGIVEFADAASAQAAIEAMDGATLDGREIGVRLDGERGGRDPAAQGAQAQPGARVFVGNLSWQTSWQGLKDHCARAGRVLFADVLTEPSGRSKGCGIVEFADEATAAAAIQSLTDSELDGRQIFLREDREPARR